MLAIGKCTSKVHLLSGENAFLHVLLWSRPRARSGVDQALALASDSRSTFLQNVQNYGKNSLPDDGKPRTFSREKPIFKESRSDTCAISFHLTPKYFFRSNKSGHHLLHDRASKGYGSIPGWTSQTDLHACLQRLTTMQISL